MRWLLTALLVCTLATCAFAGRILLLSPMTGQGLKASTTTKVGIYWWGGTVSTTANAQMYVQGRSMTDALLTSVNSTTVRVTMSAGSDSDYLGGACILGSNLTALAQRADWNTILGDSNFQTIMVTGYDWVSVPGCSGVKNYLNPTFFTPTNTAAVKAEWQNFATYLGNAFPSKTFILAAWEGDNDCWCGGSFTATIANCPTGPSHISGYQLWMQARTAGIAAANMPNVKSAIEFNDLNFLAPQGQPSILLNVVPNVPTDYVSYSFYNSKGSPQIFAADIFKIQQAMVNGGHSASSLIIGEIGFSDNSQQNLIRFLNVIRAANLPYAIVWNLLDTHSGSNTGFGAYDPNAALKAYATAMGQY